MEYYLIYNTTNDVQYIRKLASPAEAKKFINDFLNLTEDWRYESIEHLLEQGYIKRVVLY